MSEERSKLDYTPSDALNNAVADITKEMGKTFTEKMQSYDKKIDLSDIKDAYHMYFSVCGSCTFNILRLFLMGVAPEVKELVYTSVIKEMNQFLEQEKEALLQQIQ